MNDRASDARERRGSSGGDCEAPRQRFLPSNTVSVRIRRPTGPRYLQISWPGGGGARVERVPEGVTRIGGRPGVDLVIDHPTVSGIHCEIRNRGGRVTARDCGSKNGLCIQGVRVPEGEVDLGQTLQLGRAELTLLDRLPRESDVAEVLPGVIGGSAVMGRLAEQVRRLADCDLGVLITGETGTGKELVARALHDLGRRRQGPFIALNCGALPENLVEAELFGHERGAYTGAATARPGLFEAADGGTVFLDEIAELPAAQQPKLLRVLEARRVRRLGAHRSQRVDVRLVAATHASMGERIAQGVFRRDLFYRVGETTVQVPGLAERVEDIPGLVAHFEQEVRRDQAFPDPRPATLETVARLQGVRFQGNVRELRSLVRRAAVLGWEEVLATMADVAPPALEAVGGPPAAAYVAAERPPPYPVPLPALQRRMILEAYERSRGNKSEAARLLGMPKSTYGDRLRRIQEEEARQSGR